MGAALASQSQGERIHVERIRELRDGTVRITACRSQPETLESLLVASSALTPSCGLLILRGTQAVGWSCIGLAPVENFKRATMDCTQGVAATVFNSGAGCATRASELDPAFIARLGLERSTELLLLPVLSNGQVAALLLAASGNSDDLAGLEVLVKVAQLTLDLQPHHASAPVAEAQAEGSLSTELKTEHDATPLPVQASDPHVATIRPAAVLDDLHEKARRFAKLLVDEIKLYNQAKVSEGRARGDLYRRLREDIEKSRGAYQKRYGESVKDVDYFTQEVIRILADNDPMVMGTGFPG
jgi:hypothetical protein